MERPVSGIGLNIDDLERLVRMAYHPWVEVADTSYENDVWHCADGTKFRHRWEAQRHVDALVKEWRDAWVRQAWNLDDEEATEASYGQGWEDGYRAAADDVNRALDA